MAIDPKNLKATKIPGVYSLPDGKYLARVSVRVDGKVVVRKKVLDAGTRPDDLKQAVLNLKFEARNPSPTTTVPPSRPQGTSQTLEDYANHWASIHKLRLAPSSIVTLEGNLKDFILPQLGWMQCKDIDNDVVKGWVGWAEQQTKTVERRTPRLDPDGNVVKDMTFKDAYGHYKTVMDVRTVTEPYAPATMRQWWRNLKMLLQDMSAALHVPDPTFRVRPPARKQHAPKREQKTVELDALSALLDAARRLTPDRYTEIALLCLTGMRSGELFALKWDCVDLGRKQIVICRAVSRGVIRERTKTDAQRTVPMHPLVVDALTTYKQHQEQQQEGAGPRKTLTGLLFPAEISAKTRERKKDLPAEKPRLPNTLSKAFLAIREETGIEVRLGPQVLRRSLNTNLVHAGVDRLTIRNMIGHTSEQMTGVYYGATENEKMSALMKLPIKGTDDADEEPGPAGTG